MTIAELRILDPQRAAITEAVTRGSDTSLYGPLPGSDVMAEQVIKPDALALKYRAPEIGAVPVARTVQLVEQRRHVA